MRIRIHDDSCPTLFSIAASTIYKFEAVTLSQEGCPFCEMVTVDVPTEQALADIGKAIGNITTE